MSLGTHSITKDTPKNVLMGAGTVHKNFKWDSASKKWTHDRIGATAGGNGLEIIGELFDLELDGALVNWKGQTVKQGGKAKLKIKLAEITPDIIKMAMLAKEGQSDAEGYTMLEDKPAIEEGDYIENLAFVGKTANGAKNIIVIFEWALCKSGLKIDGENKKNSVLELEFEAYTDDFDGDLDTLPVKIYYPPDTAAAQQPAAE